MNEYRDSENSHVQQIVLPAANRLLIEAACRLAPVIPLADVAFVRMGQSPPGQSNNAHGEGTPLLGGPADLGAFCPFPTRWTTSPTSICAEGDILVCVRATIGEPRWSDGEYCIGRGLSAISPKNQDISSKYLFHVIKGNQEKLKKKGTGTTFKTIRKEDLEQIPVPQLSHEQQEAIGTFLEWLAHQDGHMVNWDAAPELPDEFSEQRRIVARIGKFGEWVSYAQQLRHKMKNEVNMMMNNILAEIFDNIQPRVLLKTVCETTSGGTPNRDRIDYYGGTIPWIKSGELEDSTIARAEESITELAVAESSAKIFPSGTLLVAMYGATIGKTGVLQMDAATNQAICAIFPSKDVDRDYLWWFFRRMRPSFLEMGFGGAQPNISQRVLRETEFPLPPLSEQRKIVERLNRTQQLYEEMVNLQSSTTSELNALMPSILDRAFKGEL